jgi:predicted ribonuclease toxin of YeeF-YezG toxin-antitoxin module
MSYTENSIYNKLNNNYDNDDDNLEYLSDLDNLLKRLKEESERIKEMRN